MGYSYCSNFTLFTVWVDGGPTHCFIETLNSSLLLLLTLTFGSLQLYIYWKYATVMAHSLVSKSRLFKTQVFSILLIPTLALVRFVLRKTLLYDRQVSGFMILTLSANCIAWSVCAILLWLERHTMLPSIPSRGHGLVLLSFWSLAFLEANLPFLGVMSNRWWWNLRSVSDGVEFGLWFLHYLTTIALLVLGVIAPGLPNFHSAYDNLQASLTASRTDLITGSPQDDSSCLSSSSSSSSLSLPSTGIAEQEVGRYSANVSANSTPVVEVGGLPSPAADSSPPVQPNTNQHTGIVVQPPPVTLAGDQNV